MKPVRWRKKNGRVGQRWAGYRRKDGTVRRDADVFCEDKFCGTDTRRTVSGLVQKREERHFSSAAVDYSSMLRQEVPPQYDIVGA